MLLVLTKLRGWTLPLPGPSGKEDDAPTPKRATQLGLHDGLPILLHEDGRYDEELNAWLRSLPDSGCTSPNTWMAYARDVMTWVEFFQHHKPGIPWTAATAQDLACYRDYRTTSSDNGRREAIAPTSWNRHVTALESLYKWAVRVGLVATLPFAHRMRITAGIADARGVRLVRSNSLRDPHYREEARIDFVRRDAYRRFRDVGLRWFSEDGAEDPRPNAGRQAHRNVVLADLLYLSGLRIREAASVLEWEVPPIAALNLSPTGEGLEWVVATAVAKGEKRRVIRVAQRAVRQMRDYADLERKNAIERFRAPDGTYPCIADPVLVRRVDHGHYRLLDTGKLRSIDRTRPAERRRLVAMQPDGTQSPVALWLGERGAPMQIKSWEDVFEQAEERSGVYVRPHMLRHTYAVNLLAQLVAGTIEDVVKTTDANAFHRTAQRIYAEPLNIVRRQLGHASVMQTYQYLDCLEEAQTFVDDAVARLDNGTLLTDIPWEAIKADG